MELDLFSEKGKILNYLISYSLLGMALNIGVGVIYAFVCSR